MIQLTWLYILKLFIFVIEFYDGLSKTEYTENFAENIYKLINEKKNQQRGEVYIFLLVIVDAVTHVFLQVEIDE